MTASGGNGNVVLEVEDLRVSFPNRDGGMLRPSGRVFQEVLHRVLARSGLPERERRGRPRPYIVFHDLRHTFASHWVASGGDLFKLQKILGHKTVQMTMRYAHLAPAAFREDWDRLSAAPLPVDEARVVATVR